MSNPYGELYTALWGVLASDAGLKAVADVVSQREGGIEVQQRKLDEPELIRVFLVPQEGGTVRNVSSSHTRTTERFLIAAASGHIPHDTLMEIKWALVKALNAHRTLGLAFVENVTVETIVRRPQLGPHFLGERMLTWSAELVITVTMYFDRTDLPLS